ncbi:DUF1566 domain-containing protein [Alistipes finegoldii]|uniref:Lcl C-terminal domain-containing protein n=1 Tax=Alistipes finegoldii TaxID=214856 RepID=UPI00242E6076|nr:DUF1566 domain-containing protein [Alistipes finegoldii]
MDRIIRFRTIGRDTLLRLGAAAVLLAVVSVAGCSKDEARDGAGTTGPVQEVLVKLPGVSLAPAEEVTPGVPASASGRAASRSLPAGDGPDAASGAADDLFSVTLGGPAEPAADAADAADAIDAAPASSVSAASPAGSGAEAARQLPDTETPATRADAELTNVWVFQFDAAGKAVQCRKVDALAAGRPLEVRLNSGDGYTIGVVAGGPANGLSVTNVPDLTTFREGLLFTSPVTSFEEVPYAGTLAGVRVLVNGQVQVGDSGANVPVITLRRCMAQVTVALTHNVTDYALDGVELYSVPVGAAFAPDRTAAVFPAAADANFGYRDNAAAGLAPHVQSTTGGTGRSYTWYIGQNRRGSGTGIVKVQDKNASKAPAYATYARVKTHSTTVADAPLYYDIYLGEDMFSDFNVTANHVYSYTTRIVGSAAAHFSLIDTDGRVSGKKPLYVSSASVTPSGDIPGEGKAYSLTLTGLLPDEGVQVRAQSGGTALATGKVTASGTAVSLAVPANASYTSRTVAFEYLWNGTWTKIGADRTQAGYSVSNATHNAPSTIPGQGGSYNVTLKGWRPGNLQVRVMSGSTQVVAPTASTNAPTAGDQKTTVTIPANPDAQRTLTFQYCFGKDNKWFDIASAVSQDVNGVQSATVSPDPSSGISADGATFTVTLTGNLGSGISVQARISGQTTALVSATATVSGTGVTLTVPTNSYPNAARTIVFGYVEGGEFKEIKRGTQAKGENINTGGGGTVIEPDPGQKMTWQNAINYCSSKGDGWRLPTQNELMYYWCVEPSIPADSKFSAGNYWSATESSSNSSVAWYVTFSNGGTSYTSKTARYFVRCVRDE